MQDGKQLYLDLMKRSLKNLLYFEYEFAPIMPRGNARKVALRVARKAGVALCHATRATFQQRLEGEDYSSVPHTMVSLKRLDNLQICIEQALADGVPGDLIETGVLRGGSSIFMRAVLKAYGVTDRRVWVADSFAGLPTPNAAKYPADATAVWHTFMGGDTSLEDVQRNFERYDLMDDQVRFLKGWFKDTLPVAPIEKLAILRLDGDMYESTMDALVSLYPKLSPGGFVIIDDYYLDCCRQAILDYRKQHNITEEIIDIDGAGAYWRRC